MIEDLFSEEDCDEMRRECESIVKNETVENESLVGFSTTTNDQVKINVKHLCNSIKQLRYLNYFLINLKLILSYFENVDLVRSFYLLLCFNKI